MAVKDGLPSTDFSRMNREYIKAVADEAAGGGGGGGGGSVLLITDTNGTLNKTGQQIADALTSGSVCIVVTQTTEEGFSSTTYCVISEYLSAISEAHGTRYGFICLSGESVTVNIISYVCTDLSDYPTLQL